MAKISTLVRRRYWDRMIARQTDSGLSQIEFCRRHRVSVHQFRDWKYHHRSPATPAIPAVRPVPPAVPSSGTSAFVPVRVISVRSPTAAAFELILTEGRVVRIPSDFDAFALRRLIGAVEAGPC